MQGRAPPLVGRININATSYQGLQTLKVTAGCCIMKRSPEGHGDQRIKATPAETFSKDNKGNKTQSEATSQHERI